MVPGRRCAAWCIAHDAFQTDAESFYMAALRSHHLVRFLKLTNSLSRYLPHVNGRIFLAQPIFHCRVWQRGAKWHWQCINGFEVVLASGIAEDQLAARNAAISHCLQCVSNPSGPH
jgi:hypothetical protein